MCVGETENRQVMDMKEEVEKYNNVDLVGRM